MDDIMYILFYEILFYFDGSLFKIEILELVE